MRPLVIIESPYAGRSKFRPAAFVQRWLNRRYARRCMRDAIMNHGEAPLASHLLYTQPGILRDEVPDERNAGIECGLSWGIDSRVMTAVYMDRGLSPGMQYGIKRAREQGRPVAFRYLFKPPAE